MELEKTVAELRQKLEQTERRAAELREAEEKKHTEEIQFLKKTNQQLKVSVLSCIYFFSSSKILDSKFAFFNDSPNSYMETTYSIF